MASYSSVCNAMFLLFSILLASASAEQSSAIASIIPSDLESTGTPSENYFCDTNANVYTTQVWGPTKDCFICTPYCYGACAALRTHGALSPSCTRISSTNVKCECCCVKPKAPPAPACPPPAPLPPPPPPCPSPPSSDKCDTGDDVTETTIISSNCADCTNWCNNDCSELGGRVIENKCAIGESKFARRCSCCCRGGKSLLKSVLKLS